MALKVGVFLNLPMLEPKQFSVEVDKIRESGILLLGIMVDYPNGPAFSGKWLPTLKRCLKVADMDVVVHAPFSGMNLMSLSPAIREASVREIKSSIDIANELGAKIINIHAGKITRFTEQNELAKKALKEPLSELIDYASVSGIRLSVENVLLKKGFSDNYPAVIQDCEDILSRFGELEFCLDVGHFVESGIDVYDALRRLVPRTNCVHLHDATSEEGHLVVGKGVVDFRKIISMLIFADFKGVVLIENKTVNECIESYNALKSMLSI